MPQPSFTWQDLAAGNSDKHALVAIRNKVYDVTDFLDRHPGGRSQLLVGAGRDVTQVFESYHKEETQSGSLMEKFYVGDLVTNELPTFPEPSPFYRKLRQNVRDYFEKTGQDPKYAPWMFVRYVLILSFFIAGFIGQFYFASSLVLSMLCSTVLGVSAALIGLMPMHDSSHFSITHNPTLWTLIGYTHDLFNGCSNRVWAYQHMLGHHAYTNIDGVDPDIMTAAPEIPDIRRIKHSQYWFTRYLGQHVYAPILYSLLSIKTRLQDLSILYVLRKNGSIRINPLTDVENWIVIASKIFFFAYRVILPTMFVSWQYSLVLFFYSDAVSAIWLALSFQASHVVGEVAWPLPDKNNVIQQDWAEMQIATTLDYATDSWLVTFLTGALNHQTTHHLFPGICQYYYRQVTPIVVQTCKEFNVQYNYKNTFSEALGAHINHLYNLGRQPEDSKSK